MADEAGAVLGAGVTVMITGVGPAGGGAVSCAIAFALVRKTSAKSPPEITRIAASMRGRFRVGNGACSPVHAPVRVHPRSRPEFLGVPRGPALE